MREYLKRIWNQCELLHNSVLAKNIRSVSYDSHTQSGITSVSKSSVGNPANSGTDSEFDDSPVESHVVSLFDKLKAPSVLPSERLPIIPY